VSDDGNVFDKLKAKGEEVLAQVSAELMQNPRFVKAMQGAMQGAARGRETLDRGVAQALKTMNVPTRGDVRKMTSRIEALEKELQALKGKARSKARPAARKKAAAR
jgi:polyhydroxyalkanoate synthesis regulator phasin